MSIAAPHAPLAHGPRGDRLGRGATDLVSEPGEYDVDRESDRRQELEAQAAEEVRLTDESRRGIKASSGKI